MGLATCQTEEWSATSQGCFKVKRIWIVISCESIHHHPSINMLVWESITLFVNWSHCPLDVDRSILWFLHTSTQATHACFEVVFTYAARTHASSHSCIMQSGKASIVISFEAKTYSAETPASQIHLNVWSTSSSFPRVSSCGSKRNVLLTVNCKCFFFLVWTVQTPDAYRQHEQDIWIQDVSTYEASWRMHLRRMKTYERVNLTEVRLGDLDKKGKGESQSRASSMTLHPGRSAARRHVLIMRCSSIVFFPKLNVWWFLIMCWIGSDNQLNNFRKLLNAKTVFEHLGPERHAHHAHHRHTHQRWQSSLS